PVCLLPFATLDRDARPAPALRASPPLAAVTAPAPRNPLPPQPGSFRIEIDRDRAARPGLVPERGEERRALHGVEPILGQQKFQFDLSRRVHGPPPCRSTAPRI